MSTGQVAVAQARRWSLLMYMDSAELFTEQVLSCLLTENFWLQLVFPYASRAQG